MPQSMTLHAALLLAVVGGVGCEPGRPASEPHATASGGTAKPGTPTPRDDPASCVDPPTPAVAWQAQAVQKLEAWLATATKCTAKLERRTEVDLLITTSPEGMPSARVVAATSDDCRATACIKTGMHGVVLDAPPADASPIFNLSVLLLPHEAPRRVEGRPPEDGGVVQGCADPTPDLSAHHDGRLPPEQVQAIVREGYGSFRACFEAGLARDPNLKGKVSTRFVIDREGRVRAAAVVANTLPDCQVVACVRDGFYRLHFPSPESGIVTVVYPIMLEPG